MGFAPTGSQYRSIPGNWGAFGTQTAASHSTAFTGTNNDITFSSTQRGKAGNNTRIRFVDPSADGATLSVSVTNDDITVSLGTADDTAATLATNLTGTNNDLTYTAVADGAAGNDVTVAYVDPAGNDQALDVNVTGTDIVVSLATGPAGAITSTASDVRTAVLAEGAAAALVSVANKAGNDGTGVVTALTETSLAGGFDGGDISSTAAEVVDALNGDTDAAELIVASNKSGNDGTGVVEAFAYAPLTGGADWVIGTRR